MSKDDFKFYDRHGFEAVWVNHYCFLLSRGYRLRPRYEPDWIGSWEKSGVERPIMSMCEDSLPNYPVNVIDAIRVIDGVKVSLKLVPTTTEEIPIALYLSSEAFLSDPRNRTVRILDYIPLPADDESGLLVMPFLRQFDHPPFEFRGECLEVVGQLLEGLEFMHEHNVAHRDACKGNIMMDSSRLIPGGFHHVARYTRDGIRWQGHGLIWTNRLAVKPVDYYFIDFGLSTRFPSFERRTLVTGKFGRDKTVPELSTTVPYDPFKVDIYQLGRVIRILLETYHSLRLLRPLADSMTRTDPTQRPTASEALRLFRDIESKLSPGSSKTRLVPYEDWLPWKILRSIGLRKEIPRY